MIIPFDSLIQQSSKTHTYLVLTVKKNIKCVVCYLLMLLVQFAAWYFEYQIAFPKWFSNCFFFHSRYTPATVKLDLPIFNEKKKQRKNSSIDSTIYINFALNTISKSINTIRTHFPSMWSTNEFQLKLSHV